MLSDCLLHGQVGRTGWTTDCPLLVELMQPFGEMMSKRRQGNMQEVNRIKQMDRLGNQPERLGIFIVYVVAVSRTHLGTDKRQDAVMKARRHGNPKSHPQRNPPAAAGDQSHAGKKRCRNLLHDT